VRGTGRHDPGTFSVLADRRMKPDPQGPPQLGLYALIGIGTLNLVSLLAGLGIGWYLDDRLGSFPAATLIGLAVGIAAGLTASWFQIRKYFTDAQ
jgi:Putative F0F1-ATPase subunit Ca2+/Mg2+ transporter